MRQIRNSQFAMLTILLVTVWLYAPALGFGFIWDDPICPLLGGMAGKPLETLIRPNPDFHFYRPGTLLYHRLFLTSDNTYVVPLLHAAQIGWHLLNVALIYTLSRRLGLGSWVAAAVGWLVALYPLSHQAVAWAAPQQTLVMALQNGAWLTYIEARRRRANRNLLAGLSLLLFFLALIVQESTVALSVLPLLIEWMLHRRGTGRAGWRLPCTYLLIAAGFGLLWLYLPRQTDYAALAFDGAVVRYFLQGFIFPLLGRPAGYELTQPLAPAALLILAGLTLGGLFVASRRAGRGRHALFGLTWALLGIAPSVVGLDYSYVRLGSRLFYLSGPGVALLWACALVSPRRLRQVGGAVILAIISLQSCLLLTGFQRMYATGTAHLDELVQVAQAGEPRLLFINFPDRYAPRRSPYPMGYWGVILAPVSVDLGAFPAIVTGQHPHTISRSMPWIDTAAREAGPYELDLRGVITPPDQLYQLARHKDAVYLSRHYPDGTFELQWAGDVTSAPSIDPAPACRLAVFGQTLCLQTAQVDLQPGQLSLTLTWLSLSAAQTHDTIFAHLGPAGQPPLSQADGDSWLGVLPLAFWQPGDTIREQRIIPLPKEMPAGQCEIRAGVYNRVTGERLPATTPQGEPLPDNAVVIGCSLQ